jgi:hypothetical protein
MTFQVRALVVDAAWALLASSAGMAASNRANTARNTEDLLDRADFGGMLTPSQLGNLPNLLRAPLHDNLDRERYGPPLDDHSRSPAGLSRQSR